MTVRDIAKIAGVSATTVSLVLNQKAGHISEDTRNRINAIAKENNYRPNRVAVSLATKRTHTLGVIVPDLTNQFYVSLIDRIESYAQCRNYSVLLCNCMDNLEKCMALVRMLEDRCADGIILIPPGNVNEGDKHVKIRAVLDACKKPYVLLERAVHDLFHDFVASDHKLGGYIATKHLLELGHRKIGFINGPLSEYGAKRLLSGYRDAFDEAGLFYDSELIYEGDFHQSSGEMGAKVLLGFDVTAIFCANDMMAIGALLAAERLDINVPEDLSIVGCDNNPVSEVLRVPLTTIAQPMEMMGKHACKTILSRIETPDIPHRDFYFPPSLVVRQSTSPPADLSCGLLHVQP